MKRSLGGAGRIGGEPANSVLDLREDSAPLLTIRQAAAALAVSVAHLRRLIRQRSLPTHRIGHLVRIAPDDLNAYLAKTRRGAC